MADKEPQELRLPVEFNSDAIRLTITETLEMQADDPAYKDGVLQAVPGAPLTYGVRVPTLRSMAKELVKNYRAQPEQLVELSLQLWEQATREHCLMALFTLAGLKRKLSPEKRWELGVRFLADISDWELCDQMCHALLGSALAEDPGYMDQLQSWVGDPNFWVRRAALVSTVLLRRAKYAEPRFGDVRSAA